jgi:hypothetical protein
VKLPTSAKPWWEVFVGPDKSHELAAVSNAILGLCINANTITTRTTQPKAGNNNDGNDTTAPTNNGDNRINDTPFELTTDELDMLIANHGFVVSLILPRTNGSSSGSFNDPDSFLWDHQKDLLTSTDFQ